MPVVVNDFEVVAEPQPAPRPPAEQAPAEPGMKPPLEPCAVAMAMRTLEVQALRVWAH